MPDDVIRVIRYDIDEEDKHITPPDQHGEWELLSIDTKIIPPHHQTERVEYRALAAWRMRRDTVEPAP